MWGRTIANRRHPAGLKPHTRAMIAYVVGELITRKGYKQIYDYASGQTLRFNSRFTDFDVDVTELGQKVVMSGGAFGKHFSLTHYGEQSKVDVNVAGSNFDGEHSSGPRFKGYVRENLVTFIERDSQYVFGLL